MTPPIHLYSVALYNHNMHSEIGMEYHCFPFSSTEYYLHCPQISTLCLTDQCCHIYASKNIMLTKLNQIIIGKVFCSFLSCKISKE
jgi:hypothetical protein